MNPVEVMLWAAAAATVALSAFVVVAAVMGIRSSIKAPSEERPVRLVDGEHSRQIDLGGKS